MTRLVQEQRLHVSVSEASAERVCADDMVFVRRHVRGVFRYLRVLGASVEVADDLTQEAFLVAWRKQKQALPAPALGAFLRRSARWLWLQHCRRQRREAAALLELAERSWIRECAGDDGDAFVAAVAVCIEKLAPRARLAFEAVYGREQDRVAVAAQLGLQPNGLKMLLQRARAALHECVRRQR